MGWVSKTCDHGVCKFESRGLYFNRYVVLAQILIKIVQLYITEVYTSNVPCQNYTNSNSKWISKEADHDISNRL
jgi:hypothetical protein